MKFCDSLMTCGVCKIEESAQRAHRKSSSHEWVTGSFHVVINALTGTISLTVLRNSSYICIDSSQVR